MPSEALLKEVIGNLTAWKINSYVRGLHLAHSQIESLNAWTGKAINSSQNVEIFRPCQPFKACKVEAPLKNNWKTCCLKRKHKVLKLAIGQYYLHVVIAST